MDRRYVVVLVEDVVDRELAALDGDEGLRCLESGGGSPAFLHGQQVANGFNLVSPARIGCVASEDSRTTAPLAAGVRGSSATRRLPLMRTTVSLLATASRAEEKLRATSVALVVVTESCYQIQ